MTQEHVALQQMLDWGRAQQAKTPEEELARAGEARQILESRMFREARARIESSLAAKRRQAPIRDTDMHTRLILMEQLWGQLISFLEQTAQTGQFAEASIRQKNTLIERMRNFTRL